MVRQTEAAECGLACLAMVASYHGHRIDLNTLAPPLSGVAERRHACGRSSRSRASCTSSAGRSASISSNLRQLRLPAILHWDMSHFVVLKSVGRQGIVVHDPASGERYLPLAEASKHLTGVALELSPTDSVLRPGRASAAAVFGLSGAS